METFIQALIGAGIGATFYAVVKTLSESYFKKRNTKILIEIDGKKISIDSEEMSSEQINELLESIDTLSESATQKEGEDAAK